MPKKMAGGTSTCRLRLDHLSNEIEQQLTSRVTLRQATFRSFFGIRGWSQGLFETLGALAVNIHIPDYGPACWRFAAKPQAMVKLVF